MIYNFKKNIKRFILCLLSIITLFSSNVFAAETTTSSTDEKLTKFVQTSAEEGYLNINLNIVQLSNKKYRISFYYKENLTGMDYGFYLLPTVKNTIESLGYDCKVTTKENYGTITFSYTTKNIQKELTKLSTLPFITLNGYVDEDSYELLIDGSFDEELFKELRENNEFIRDILGTNKYTFTFSPIVKNLSSSNSPYLNKNNDYVWISTDEVYPDISIICKPLTKGTIILEYILIGFIILLIIVLIIFIIRKINKKRNNNYYDDDYDNYHDDYYN